MAAARFVERLNEQISGLMAVALDAAAAAGAL
jgi:hypothetical protein